MPGRDSHSDAAAVAKKSESSRRAGGTDADVPAGRCGTEHQPAIALGADRARVGRDIRQSLIALEADRATLGPHADRDIIGHLDPIVRGARAEYEHRTTRNKTQIPKPNAALLTRAVPIDRVVATANRNTRPAAANDRDIARLHSQLDPKQLSRHRVGDRRGAGAVEPPSGENSRSRDQRHQRANDEERPRRKAPQHGARLRRSGNALSAHRRFSLRRKAELAYPVVQT